MKRGSTLRQATELLCRVGVRASKAGYAAMTDDEIEAKLDVHHTILTLLAAKLKRGIPNERADECVVGNRRPTSSQTKSPGCRWP